MCVPRQERTCIYFLYSPPLTASNSIWNGPKYFKTAWLCLRSFAVRTFFREAVASVVAYILRSLLGASTHRRVLVFLCMCLSESEISSSTPCNGNRSVILCLRSRAFILNLQICATSSSLLSMCLCFFLEHVAKLVTLCIVCYEHVFAFVLYRSLMQRPLFVRVL